MDAMGIGHITKSEESCLDFVLRPMMDNPLASWTTATKEQARC